MPSSSNPSRAFAHNERSRIDRTRFGRLLRSLERVHPDATCALVWSTPFELLVATILSAQCTDERVNAVTPSLFRRYPEARTLAVADTSELESLIRSTGFYRSKARSLLSCAKTLVTDHDGRVPSRMNELVRLPGVGRKTANIVLGHAFKRAEGIAVDTHVQRLARRLGLTSAESPEDVETDLMKLAPKQSWTRLSDLLIFHGRRYCTARRPACGRCPISVICEWPEKPSGQTDSRRTPGFRRRRLARRGPR